MQGLSTCTYCTSNHEILNALIPQMKMSPVNPEEQVLCVLLILPACYPVVVTCLCVQQQ